VEKVPTLVLNRNADIQQAAKRILWENYLMLHRHCVAPDYVLIHEKLKQPFIEECQKSYSTVYGTRMCKIALITGLLIKTRYSLKTTILGRLPKDEIVFVRIR